MNLLQLKFEDDTTRSLYASLVLIPFLIIIIGLILIIVMFPTWEQKHSNDPNTNLSRGSAEHLR